MEKNKRLGLVDYDENDFAAAVDQSQPQPQTVPSEPLEISGDDFMDVSDDLSLPTPSPSPPPEPKPQASDCPVNDYLLRLGIGLKRDMLAVCLGELGDSVKDFQRLSVAEKAKHCFRHLVFSDFRYCGSGVLPHIDEKIEFRILPGPYVLQVDEMFNMTCPLRSRYEKAPAKLETRCLKLSMTDGSQRVFGIEHKPIKALELSASPGFKVQIRHVQVRYGTLMLVPEAITVLGGLVKELVEDKKRVVDKLNKPARGERNGEGPPLLTRATNAAWPPSRVDDLCHKGSTLHISDTVQENDQAATNHWIPGTGTNLTTEDASPMDVGMMDQL